jgi:hypothetical protein
MTGPTNAADTMATLRREIGDMGTCLGLGKPLKRGGLLVNFPFLLFSRIVSRINEDNATRTGEVNLEDHLLVRCPGMMNVIRGQHEN